MEAWIIQSPSNLKFSVLEAYLNGNYLKSEKFRVLRELKNCNSEQTCVWKTRKRWCKQRHHLQRNPSPVWRWVQFFFAFLFFGAKWKLKEFDFALIQLWKFFQFSVFVSVQEIKTILSLFFFCSHLCWEDSIWPSPKYDEPLGKAEGSDETGAGDCGYIGLEQAF